MSQRRVIVKKYNPEEKTKWVKKIKQIMETKKLSAMDACAILARDKEILEIHPDMTGSKLLATFKAWVRILAEEESTTSSLPRTTTTLHNNNKKLITVKRGDMEFSGDPEAIAQLIRSLDSD